MRVQQKRMEKFDGNLNELEILSKGYWGTIYILSDDYLLKTSSTSEDMTIDEFNRTRAVFEAGIPCAEAVKMVETEKGPGIIIERMSGRSIARRASQHLESLDTYLDAYVKLAQKMWTTSLPAGTLPTVKQDLLDIADGLREFMDHETVDEYIDFIHALPDGDKFLHMDFHWSNVMYNGGDSKLIDMPNACMGHPAFDMMAVACYYNLELGYEFDGKTYQEIFRISEEDAAYVWDTLCKRIFAGLPADVAADRKKCVEKLAGLVFAHHNMRDYVLGIASERYVNDIRTFLENILREDKDFAIRVLNEWKI